MIFKQVKRFLALGLLCTASSVAQAETIRLAVTDLVGMEELQREFGAFKEVLSKKLGADIEFLPVTNRTAAVEALRFKKIDYVLTGPAEYIVFKKRTNANIVVGFSRPDYFASLITLADSPYTTVSSLKGEKIALGSVGSTSKHLGPIQVMADYGMNPSKDAEIHHTSMNIAWEALKRGDVAAVGMNHLKFLSFRNKEMKKENGLQPGAFRVVGRGPDLPNDILLAGSHVSKKQVEKVRRAFVENSDEIVDAILVGDDNQKYQGMKFLASVKDEDYNYVRSMYKTAGYPEFSDFIGD